MTTVYLPLKKLSKELITKEMTKDDLAIFMAYKLLKIKNYNFDVFYDIAFIVNQANVMHRDQYGQIITNVPCEYKYTWFLRDTGSYLLHDKDTTTKEHLNKVFDHHSEYQITITSNCDYLHNVPFAKVTKLK